MKLSRKTHQQLESFFRKHFADDKLKLPEIEIFAKRGAAVVTKALSVHGITFGRHIFIKPSLIIRKGNRGLYISKELRFARATNGWKLIF